MNAFPPDGPPLPEEVEGPLPPTDPKECGHDTIIYHECLECETPLSKMKHHLCCWAWKLALIVPAIHLVLHFLGVPHPEFIAFIP